MATIPESRKPSQLKIAIVGAGMGGLTLALSLAKAGFEKIHVYEHAPGLGFVGAGIQLAANMSRILDRLGVWDEIRREAVLITANSIREGASDEELGHFDFTSIKHSYGYPHMVGHRADLANGLYQGCVREKTITFHLGCPVQDIRRFEPAPIFTVAPANGPAYDVEADLLLAADGVKSATRAAMLKHLATADLQVQETGQAAYRILLPRKSMEQDPELLSLIDDGCVTRWTGERRHIIAYPISSNQLYNISTVQPDVNFAGAPSSTWTTAGSKSEMLEVFGGFCSRISRLLHSVPGSEVVEWKLQVHSPLPTWSVGAVGLLGDACHPTLPHLGQGAAMAIEDAAVLATILAKLPDTAPATIHRCLRTYEAMRRPRTTVLVGLAAATGKAAHLGDGEAKRQRDLEWKKLRDGQPSSVPEGWADKRVQDMVYGTDVVQLAELEFDHAFASLSP